MSIGSALSWIIDQAKECSKLAAMTQTFISNHNPATPANFVDINNYARDSYLSAISLSNPVSKYSINSLQLVHPFEQRALLQKHDFEKDETSIYHKYGVVYKIPFLKIHNYNSKIHAETIRDIMSCIVNKEIKVLDYFNEECGTVVDARYDVQSSTKMGGYTTIWLVFVISQSCTISFLQLEMLRKPVGITMQADIEEIDTDLTPKDIGFPKLEGISFFQQKIKSIKKFKLLADHNTTKLWIHDRFE